MERSTQIIFREELAFPKMPANYRNMSKGERKVKGLASARQDLGCRQEFHFSFVRKKKEGNKMWHIP